jgi:lysozyme family protein
MARFEIAEKITGGNEGGWANNPNDRGGETYAGIARKFWPQWGGWKYIDKYKADYAKLNKPMQEKYSLARWINSSAKVTTEPVHAMVSAFYKINFWDVNKLDQINDQQIANTVYDFGVNSGTPKAAKYLQQALGVAQDGIIGPGTLGAVNSIPPKITHNKYNALRETFYRSIAKGNQAEFLRSWLSRLKPYQG